MCIFHTTNVESWISKIIMKNPNPTHYPIEGFFSFMNKKENARSAFQTDQANPVIPLI